MLGRINSVYRLRLPFKFSTGLAIDPCSTGEVSLRAAPPLFAFAGKKKRAPGYRTQVPFSRSLTIESRSASRGDYRSFSGAAQG